MSSALLISLSLTACNPANSKVAVKIICPEITKYDQATQDRALAEYKALPSGSAIKLMIGDYKQLRDRVRACRGG
jgi:hypothetical protein